jgi:SAM-dependent methyltransferase
MSIRNQYAELGVRAFYEREGARYRNPHEGEAAKVLAHFAPQLDLGHPLDIACGSGEMTLALRRLGAGRVTGLDPYTASAYLGRTGQEALPLLFEDIARGALPDNKYTLGVCSFALHLVDDSYLPSVCLELAEVMPDLVVISPNKKPELRKDWGWELLDRVTIERVHGWHYFSTIHGQYL